MAVEKVEKTGSGYKIILTRATVNHGNLSGPERFSKAVFYRKEDQFYRIYENDPRIDHPRQLGTAFYREERARRLCKEYVEDILKMHNAPFDLEESAETFEKQGEKVVKVRSG
ncbi:MAG: hypothetical protein SVV03_01230 [Candidatus Nanohaloarchaea archaeon]|nr:hypothetical protein [Candidatus Nanohaloarchaea archaeon]